MKRSRLLVSVWVLLAACSGPRHIGLDALRVVRTEQHPFLTDHCRRLNVLDARGQLLDETRMYCDPGEGCSASLFEEKRKFILIDCNGQWFTVHKRNGRIKKEAWEWERPLPAGFVGTFVRAGRGEPYRLDTSAEASLQTVYRFKDPN